MKHFLFFIIFTINSLNVFSQSFSRNEFGKNNFKHADYKQVIDTSFLITHSISQEIIPETSVSCNKNGVQYENSYYRVFDLSSPIFNINGDWTVQQVQVGIAYSKGGIDTLQNAKLILYQMSSYNGIIPLDSLNQRGDTINFQVSDNETGTIKTIPIQPAVSIPKGNVLVVEVLIPDGQQDGNMFFIGSNDLPQTDKTFILAKHCNVENPIDVTDIGYPDMHLIINVIGAYDAANPQILSFNIEGQLSETEISNNPNLISLVLPADTTLDKLHPNIVVPAGFYVFPASGVEVDFSQGAIEFSVTNEYSKIAESWFATVSKATPDILSFSIPNQVGETVIDNTNHTVHVTMPSGTDLTNLSPTISIYRDFEVTPTSGTTQDFSLGAVTYTVSHSNISLSQNWSVTVTAESKFNKTSELSFYPNPVNNFINFYNKEINLVEIFNISGELIISSKSDIIDVRSLNKGVYFTKIYTKNSIETLKFIKK